MNFFGKIYRRLKCRIIHGEDFLRARGGTVGERGYHDRTIVLREITSYQCLLCGEVFHRKTKIDRRGRNGNGRSG